MPVKLPTKRMIGTSAKDESAAKANKASVGFREPFIENAETNPQENDNLDRQNRSSSAAATFDGDWEGYIKRVYLDFGNDGNELLYSRTRLSACWRCLYRIAKLPWTAMLLITIAIALISVFIVFIVNSPSSRAAADSVIIVNGSEVVASSTNLVTIQCETDVTKEECEKRAQERLSARDFQQAMTETHLFTTLIMFWLAATIFFVIKAVRTRKRNRYLENLPRSSILVFADLNTQPPGGASGSSRENGIAQPAGSITSTANGPTSMAGLNNLSSTANASSQAIGSPSSAPSAAPSATTSSTTLRDDITTYMTFKVPVHHEMQRTIHLRRYLLYYVEKAGTRKPTDTNWGWRGEWMGVHFPSTVKPAFHDYLEKQAIDLDPTLKLRRDQTVREWLGMLKSRFSNEQLNHGSLDALADFYEQARFSDESLDEFTWMTSMQHAYNISMSLAMMVQQQQSRSNTQAPVTMAYAPPLGRQASTTSSSSHPSSPNTPIKLMPPVSPFDLSTIMSSGRQSQKAHPSTGTTNESYATALDNLSTHSAVTPGTIMQQTASRNSTSSSLNSSTSSEPGAISPQAEAHAQKDAPLNPVQESNEITPDHITSFFDFSQIRSSIGHDSPGMDSNTSSLRSLRAGSI